MRHLACDDPACSSSSASYSHLTAKENEQSVNLLVVLTAHDYLQYVGYAEFGRSSNMTDIGEEYDITTNWPQRGSETKDRWNEVLAELTRYVSVSRSLL